MRGAARGPSRHAVSSGDQWESACTKDIHTLHLSPEPLHPSPHQLAHPSSPRKSETMHPRSSSLSPQHSAHTLHSGTGRAWRPSQDWISLNDARRSRSRRAKLSSIRSAAPPLSVARRCVAGGASTSADDDRRMVLGGQLLSDHRCCRGANYDQGGDRIRPAVCKHATPRREAQSQGAKTCT